MEEINDDYSEKFELTAKQAPKKESSIIDDY
jgi:hypothetical protein